MDQVTAAIENKADDEEEMSEDLYEEEYGPIQQRVQMPRFIRVNNKTSGTFVKLTGKPYRSTQSSTTQH